MGGFQPTPYAIVIASDIQRAQETALLITGQIPVIDARAGFDPSFTTTQLRCIDTLAAVHPFGSAGAIFEHEEFIKPIQRIGQQLVALIKETLETLPPGGTGFIVSHDATMVAAMKILKREPIIAGELDKGYGFLEGFKVTEALAVEDLWFAVVRL